MQPKMWSYLQGFMFQPIHNARLVHRREFKRPTASEQVQELSVDGGKIRLRTPLGEPCSWRDYKGVRLHEQGTQAFFQDNHTLVDWINSQPLAEIVTCVGDGHDGVWNIIRQLAPEQKRREILDWDHLIENRPNVGGSIRRLRKAESLLWRGQVDETQALFANMTHKQAHNFCDYLEKHRHRIVNYEYFQSEQICSIGSGAVESAVKQIDRRTKISGAQWNIKNVPKRVSSSMRLFQWSYLEDYVSDRSLAKVTCSPLLEHQCDRIGFLDLVRCHF